MTRQPRIEAAVFDLGGVLIDVDIERTVRAWAGMTGLSPEEIRRRLDGRILSDEFERGEIGAEEFRRDVCRRLEARLSRQEFERGWLALLGGPLPGAMRMLEGLAGRLRLVALTNTNEIHTAVWRRTCAALLAPFERILTSHDIGARKPEPAAFQAAIDCLGLPPGRVAFFDDNPQNIEAAARLGLVARLTRGPQDVGAALAAFGIRLDD